MRETRSPVRETKRKARRSSFSRPWRAVVSSLALFGLTMARLANAQNSVAGSCTLDQSQVQNGATAMITCTTNTSGNCQGKDQTNSAALSGKGKIACDQEPMGQDCTPVSGTQVFVVGTPSSNPATTIFKYTAPASGSGTDKFDYTINTANGCTTDLKLDVPFGPETCPPPTTISSSSPLTFTAGDKTTITISLTPPHPSVGYFAEILGQPPAGCVITQSGPTTLTMPCFFDTFQQQGLFDVLAEYTEDPSCVTSQAFTFSVAGSLPAGGPCKIFPPRVNDAVVGQNYSVIFTASPQEGKPYHFASTFPPVGAAGNPGMIFVDNNDGLTATLSGKPSMTGVIGFSVVATDKDGHACQHEYTLVVTAVPQPDLTPDKDSDHPSGMRIGDQVKFRVLVENIGTAPTAGNWFAKDKLPPELQYVMADATTPGLLTNCTSSTSGDGTTVVTCESSTTIPPNQAAEILIVTNVIGASPNRANQVLVGGGGEVRLDNDWISVPLSLQENRGAGVEPIAPPLLRRVGPR